MLFMVLPLLRLFCSACGNEFSILWDTHTLFEPPLMYCADVLKLAFFSHADFKIFLPREWM